MNRKMLGFVAVAAFLAVEMSAGTADAQRLMQRMRSRFGRTQTQCCPVANTCQTTTCGSSATCGNSASFAIAPVSYSEPVCTSGPILESPVTSSCGCGGEVTQTVAPVQQFVDSGSIQVIPAAGCDSCGSIQPASYMEPIAATEGQYIVQGEYFGGDSGCVGCESPIQGCVSGNCGSVVSEGSIVHEGDIVEGAIIDSGVVSGEIIEGGVIESEVAPSESGNVPEPPAEESASDDQDA